MSANVETRFAGGAIEVDTAELPATGIYAVSFRAPCAEFPLFAHEARALAAALLSAAEVADQGEGDRA